MKITFKNNGVELRKGSMSIFYSNIENAINGKPYFIYGGDQEKIKQDIIKAKLKSI